MAVRSTPADVLDAIPQEDIRIGVYVCHCGTNIGGIVNVQKIVQAA